jgi:chemotaxis protein CheD
MRAPGSLPSGFDRGHLTTVHQGDCLTSDDPGVTFSTVLGSCVAACIRDVVAGVGGMNHFLLAEPKGVASDRFGASARYGAFAMEQLINKVLTRGSGKKSNLEIKVFGGGMISSAMQDVGAKNLAFIHDFLGNEGYATTNEDSGGKFARRLLYKPVSGRAVVKRLDERMRISIAEEELMTARRNAVIPPAYREIELF